jgi:predicted nucleotidyltransferase
MIDTRGYGRRLAAAIDGLVGLYVHGSLALGGFRPERSDVDVLAVVEASMSADRQLALGRALLSAAYPCLGTGLEMSVITASTAADLGDCPFEVHVATPETVTPGADHPGDPDLVLYAEVCRRSGIVVAGPPAEAVFGQVPRDRLIDSMIAELEWGLSSAPFEYAVLNACRALLFASDGSLCSKVDGGDWYLGIHAGDPIVTAALARQRGGDRGPEPAHDAVAALVGAARQDLRMTKDGGA